LAGTAAAGFTVATAAIAESIIPAYTPRPAPSFKLLARPIPKAGFSGGSAYVYANSTDQGRMCDVVTAGKTTGIRFDIPWYFAQPSATTYNWTFIDNAVNLAYNRGFFILAVITSTPPWAAVSSNGNAYNRPANATDYANFCRAVATRYNGKIDAYEIWNEPNARSFFAPNPDPVFYTSMVKAGYTAIKSVNSAITVVAGALGPVPNSDGLIDANTFLAGMYQNGVKGSFDALSFHPYDFTGTFAQGAVYDNSPMRQMISMHARMTANGEGAKKIWVTEYGAPTIAGITEDKQADLIYNSLQQWQGISYAGPFFIYTMRDSNTGTTNPEDHFGVVTTSYAIKKALYAVQALGNAGYPPPQEYTIYQQYVDPALGPAVSPAYQIGTGWAVECENGTRFVSGRGAFSSPPDVGTLARHVQLVAITPFANGMQDFDKPEGFRVFSRTTTGTRSVGGSILAAWTADLGFPTSDQYTVPNTVNQAQDFEHGRITWAPGTGAQVIRL
jgi:hypothetical protein